MVGLFGWAARKMPVTPKKTGLLALLEFGLVWVRDEVVYAWLGPEEGRRYLPLMWTIFFFILFSNLFGLFPFTVVPFGRTDALSVATGNLAVTGAMAFIVFVVVLMAGFRKHGIGGYWGTLVPDGVPMPLVPIIFLLEVIGLLTRAFALAIRLFANMLAGHALPGDPVQLRLRDLRLRPSLAVGPAHARLDVVPDRHLPLRGADRAHPGVHLHHPVRHLRQHLRR